MVLAGGRVLFGRDARQAAAVRDGLVAGAPAGLQGAAGQHGGRRAAAVHDTLRRRVEAEPAQGAHLLQQDRHTAVRQLPGAAGQADAGRRGDLRLRGRVIVEDL